MSVHRQVHRTISIPLPVNTNHGHCDNSQGSLFSQLEAETRTVEICRRPNLKSGSSASILLHVFSEGGSNKACELAEAYFNTTGRRLPVSALCLDSTPGHPRFGRLCNALGKSLPQIPVLRHASLFVGTALLGAVWITYNVFIGFDNNVITKTRERLLDTTHFDPTAPRCYLYSQDDALIAWQDVKEHAEISMECGIPVNEVMFQGSGHVGHARQEPQRYWDAVMATWQTAGAFKEKSRLAMLVEEIKSNEYKRWSDATLLSARVTVREM
jgi:hypothetical protein